MFDNWKPTACQIVFDSGEIEAMEETKSTLEGFRDQLGIDEDNITYEIFTLDTAFGKRYELRMTYRPNVPAVLKKLVAMSNYMLACRRCDNQIHGYVLWK